MLFADSLARRLVAASAAALALSLAVSASAQQQAAPMPDARTPKDGAWDDVARPWLYTADPTAPPAGHVLAGLGVSYAQVDRGAARPFAADRAHAGAVMSASAEVGLHRFVSIYGEGLLSGEGAGASVSGGGLLGVTFYPLRAKSAVDLSVAAGYLRELGGANGVWGRAAVAGDLGPARLALTAVGSHVFAPGRDEVDFLLTAGASVALVPIFRLGVEYVVQDIEGAWDPEEADGGIRHFLGPTASLELARRVRLTAGPAFGMSPESPRLLGRIMASYAF